jgi:glycerol-3-phosphate dehydrogenase subunit B
MTSLVIGGGFAGLAAAWALSRRGREVRIVWEGAGASSLYSGALDRGHWGALPDTRPLGPDAEAFLAVLGCFAPSGTSGGRVATSAGVLRPARCRDRALLDLEPWRGRRIDVVDLGRPGWDAAALARAWSQGAWARQTHTDFQPVPVAPPELDAVRLLPSGELAARADDPEWLARLGQALARAGDGERPLLIGPWLGLEPASVERLRAQLRRPIGETLSEPGGAAGARFEAARDGWLSSAGLAVELASVRSIRWRGSRYEVLGAREDGEVYSLGEGITEIVLAIGGVVGGGVRFLAGGGPEGRSFSLSLDAELPVRLAGREVALSSGALGVDLQQLGLDALSEVGVSVDERALARAPALYAAGDVVEGRPRCALDAIDSGLEAARAACRAPSSPPLSLHRRPSLRSSPRPELEAELQRQPKSEEEQSP